MTLATPLTVQRCSTYAIQHRPARVRPREEGKRQAWCISPLCCSQSKLGSQRQTCRLRESISATAASDRWRPHITCLVWRLERRSQRWRHHHGPVCVEFIHFL